MKIIAIRLKNLTSIEGSVEIDFTVENRYVRLVYSQFPGLQELASRLCWMLCVLHYMIKLPVLRPR